MRRAVWTAWLLCMVLAAIYLTALNMSGAAGPPIAPREEKTTVAVAGDIAPAENQVFSVEPLQASQIDIAEAYAADIKKPPYSLPLGPDDFGRLNPNHFYPVSGSIGASDSRVQLTLNKYRFVCPEPIVVEVLGDDVEVARVTLLDLDSKKTLQSAALMMENSRLTATLSGSCAFPPNLAIVGAVQMTDGQFHKPQTSLEYQLDSPATLTGIGAFWADGPDMIIEADLQVKKAGLFYLSGNLFDYLGAPIAHLKSRADLEVGNETIILRAHQSVLQNRGSSFSLDDLLIKRLPSDPSERISFGVSKVGRHEIGHFDVEILEVTEHQPTPAQLRRFEFLKKLVVSGS